MYSLPNFKLSDALWGVVHVCVLVFSTQSIADTGLPFQLHRAQYQSVDNEITLDASFEAVSVATVSSQVSGRVIGVHFDVDDQVDKGQILVRLASRAQRARVDAIEAKQLEAQAQFNIDQKEFDRVQKMYAKKLVAKSILDKSDAKRRGAKEQLKSASARLRDAETKLRYAVVRAPYSGVVVKRHIQIGELAKIGQPLMTGLSLKSLRLIAFVPQRHIQAIRDSTEVSISYVSSGKTHRVKSKDITVSPQADADSHNFIVRVNLPENSIGLYPGMYGTLSFTSGVSKKILVPSDAIASRSELKALYVVAGINQVQLRQVRVGAKYPDGKTEILAGLNDGERIALDPVAATIYLKRAQ